MFVEALSGEDLMGLKTTWHLWSRPTCSPRLRLDVVEVWDKFTCKVTCNFTWQISTIVDIKLRQGNAMSKTRHQTSTSRFEMLLNVKICHENLHVTFHLNFPLTSTTSKHSLTLVFVFPGFALLHSNLKSNDRGWLVSDFLLRLQNLSGSDCNSLRYYTPSLNSKPPPPFWLGHRAPTITALSF